MFVNWDCVLYWYSSRRRPTGDLARRPTERRERRPAARFPIVIARHNRVPRGLSGCVLFLCGAPARQERGPAAHEGFEVPFRWQYGHQQHQQQQYCASRSMIMGGYNQMKLGADAFLFAHLALRAEPFSLRTYTLHRKLSLGRNSQPIDASQRFNLHRP